MAQLKLDGFTDATAAYAWDNPHLEYVDIEIGKYMLTLSRSGAGVDVEINYDAGTEQSDWKNLLMQHIEHEEAAVEVCPRCGNTCNGDVTIADHGMCYDCFHRQTMGWDNEADYDQLAPDEFDQLILKDFLGVYAPHTVERVGNHFEVTFADVQTEWALHSIVDSLYPHACTLGEDYQKIWIEAVI